MKKHLLFLLCSLLVAWNLHAQQSVGYQDNWPKPNGEVRAIVRSGNTVYLGGNFNYIGYNKPYGASFNTISGTLDLSFVKPDGTVRACVPDGAGGWYIGGEFTHVGGQTRNHLARINANGTLHPWNPSANDWVFTLAVSGSTVYVGGWFSTIGGQSRNRIAALDATTGNASSWNPNANSTVLSLAVSGSTVYAGGVFNNIGGQSRNRIAALDATTGNATSWNPNANNTVLSLAVSGSTVYVGGGFNSIGGQSRSNLAALDATTGNASSWNPNASGVVRALAVSGSTVYAGGDFNSIGGQSRNYLAALDATSGNATSWDPNADNTVQALAVSGNTVYAGGDFNTIGGQSRNRIAALEATSGNATSWDANADNTVLSLAASGSTVYAGGGFTSMGGRARNNIAALDATTGALLPWNPNANDWVLTLAVSGSTVYVGGWFSTIGGQSRNRIAALDATTGNASSWNPNANSTVLSLAVSGSTVYAGGVFNNIGGQSRNRIAALDATTGNATSWNPNANNTVLSLAVSGSTVYVGGGFNSIGGQSRSNLAALDATTGNASSWNPNASGVVRALAVSGSTVYVGGEFNSIGGQTRNNMAALDATSGNATSWNPSADGSISALAVSGSTVYVGGGFSTIGGQARNNMAALDATTGNATSWNPNANIAVFSLAVSGSTVYAGGEFTSMGGDYTRNNFMSLVDSNNLPTVSIAASTDTVCAGTSVTFTATPTGASSPTYQWMKNGTAISGETAATYTTTTLANGDSIACQMTDGGSTYTSSVIEMTVNAAVTPAVSIWASANPVQAGTSVTFYAGSLNGGTAPQYEWRQNGNVVGTNSDVFTTSNLNNGDVISCLLTSNAACTATDTASSNAIQMNVSPYCIAVGTNHLNVIFNVTVAGINNNSGNNWGVNGYEDFTSQTGTMAIGGSYPFSAFVAGTGPNRIGVWIDFNQDNDFNDPGEQVIGAAFSPRNFSGTIAVPATALTGPTRMRVRYNVFQYPDPCDGAGVYISGNIEDYTINITPPCPAQSVSAAASTLTPCAGSPVTFIATPTNGGATPQYQWMVDGTAVSGATSDTFTTSFTASSQVSVVMTPTTPCPSTPTVESPALNVTVNPLPVASISNNGVNPICIGSTTVLSASPVAAGNRYSWTRTSASGTAVADTTAQYTTGSRGDYTVSVTDANGCVGTSAPYTLVVKTPPAVTAAISGTTALCAGGSVVLSFNPTVDISAYPNYQWTNNGVAIPGATSLSHTATTAGSYALSISDSTGCGRTSAARVVTVNPNPIAAFTASGPTTFCQGGSVTLSATNYPNQTYRWLLNGAPYSTSLSRTITTSGTYQLQARLGSCTVLSPATTVTVNPLPAAAIVTSGPSTICSGNSVLLQATPNVVSNSYVWKRGAAVLASSTAQHNANATGNYRVTVTDTNGCTQTSALHALTVVTPPTATITPLGATTIGANGSVVLQANAGTGFTYQWYRNNLPISGAMAQTYTATSGGSYTVMVTSGACSKMSAARVVTKTSNKEALGVTSTPTTPTEEVLETAFTFSAFPNPAGDRVTVSTQGAVSQSATVQVMTLTGAAVKEVEMLEAQTEIDLSGMASGIYLLRYKDTEGRTGIIRLVKQ